MELSNNEIVSGMRKLKDDQDFMFGKTGQIEQMMIDLRHKEVLPAIEDAKEVSEKVDNLVKESKVNKQSISNVQQAIEGAKASSNAAIARAQELLKDITTINDKWDDTDKRLAEQIDSLSGLADGLDKAKAELDKLSDQAKAQGKTVITLQQNADGLTQAVADVKGNVTSLQQLSDLLKTQLSAQDGRLTVVETKAGEMTTTLSKQQTTIDDQGKTIAGQGQLINQVKQTAAEATQTLVDQGKAINEVQSTASQLRVGLQTANGDINDLKMTSQGLSNQVGNMVSKADLADTTKKITDLSTLVDQTKSAVDIKANQTDVDRLKQSVSDANAKIGVQANQITNLVTKSDLTTATNGLATQNWVQTQVAQQANQWNLNIAQLETKTTESLKGAGVNLQVGTAKGGLNSTESAPNGSARLTTNQYSLIPGGGFYFNFEKGKTYTVGFYLTCNSTPPENLYVDVTAFAVKGNSNIWSGSVWVSGAKTNDSGGGKIVKGTNHYEFTFVADKEYTKWGIYKKPGSITTTTVTLDSVKLELGSTSTPWTPAPSDLATVKSVVDITAALDGVRQTVQSKADKSETTQLANAMKTMVTNDQLTTAIKQTADTWNASLTDKTKGDALIAQINQTAGKTLIQNDKLVISANSTIIDGTAFIKSANIVDINADKITTGMINTNKLSIGNGSDWFKLQDGNIFLEGPKTTSTSVKISPDSIKWYWERNASEYATLGLDEVKYPINSMQSRSWFVKMAPANYIPQLNVFSGGVSITDSLLFNQSDWNTSDTSRKAIGFKRYGNKVHFTSDKNIGEDLIVETGTRFKKWNYFDGDVRTSAHLYADGNVQINGGEITANTWWSDAGSDFFAIGSKRTNNYTVAQAKSFSQISLLSQKTNIQPLEADEVIKTLKSVDMYSYQYKSDVQQGESKRYASLIIDDVNEVSQYRAPKEFLSSQRNSREDGSLVAYLTVAVQNLLKRVEELESERK